MVNESGRPIIPRVNPPTTTFTSFHARQRDPKFSAAQVSQEKESVNTQATLKGNSGGHHDMVNSAAVVPSSRIRTKLLSYPENNANQGHFIIFQIHSNHRGHIKRDPLGPVPAENTDDSTTEPGDALATAGLVNRSNYFSYNIEGIRKRVGTQIALFMPASVQTSYKSNYEDTEISTRGAGINNLIEAVKSGSVSGSVGAIGDAVQQTLVETLKGIADITAPGIVGLSGIDQGRVIGSKMELFFKGVGRRQFTYTFVFIPKSETESQIIDSIITEFKTAMLPTYSSGQTLISADLPIVGSGPQSQSGMNKTLNIPTTVDIKYMYQDKAGFAENAFLNKISTCFITDMQVNYGGDRYTAHSETNTNRQHNWDGTKMIEGSGTPPQRTSVTLTFNEIEIITQEAAAAGY